MSELSISYKNFHPSQFTKDYLDKKLGTLAARSPGGSLIKAVFTVENGGITACLSINSYAGEFIALSKGRFLKDVNRRLLAQAQRQLSRWHQRTKAA